jgi:hypothetical protein
MKFNVKILKLFILEKKNVLCCDENLSFSTTFVIVSVGAGVCEPFA